MSMPEENPYRPHKDPGRGWIAGVCAGLADYLNVSVGLVRFLAVLALGFFFLPASLAYVALALMLRPKPRSVPADRAEQDFWRGVATDPPRTVRSLRDTFRACEERLIRMEAFVTSPEFDLRQRFRDLGPHDLGAHDLGD